MKLTNEEISIQVKEMTGRVVANISEPVTELVAISTVGYPEEDNYSLPENQFFFGDISITSHNMPIRLVIETNDGFMFNQDAEISNQTIEQVVIKSVHMDRGKDNGGAGVSVELIGVIVTLLPGAKFKLGDRVTVADLFVETAYGIITEVQGDTEFTYSIDIHFGEDKLLSMSDVYESYILSVN